MPKDNIQIHMARFTLIDAIRTFFKMRNFADVLTPVAVSNPGNEVHIHPFRLQSVYQNKLKDTYLHTSPEFQIKELLAAGLGDAFSINYVFRDEPESPHHRPQFIMLEWYRVNQRYEAIMEDCQSLFRFCQKFLTEKKVSTIKEEINVTRITVSELFKKYCHFDILNYSNVLTLEKLIRTNFPHIPLPSDEKLPWDDLFFLLFLNEIEPHLSQGGPYLVYEFPAPLSAYSTIKEEDPRVCERFEIFWKGLELCNCFNELTDYQEQKKRIQKQSRMKKKSYGYTLPSPDSFYQAMAHGLPQSSGVALGVERLLMALTGIENPFYR